MFEVQKRFKGRRDGLLVLVLGGDNGVWDLSLLDVVKVS